MVDKLCFWGVLCHGTFTLLSGSSSGAWEPQVLGTSRCDLGKLNYSDLPMLRNLTRGGPKYKLTGPKYKPESSDAPEAHDEFDSLPLLHNNYI